MKRNVLSIISILLLLLTAACLGGGGGSDSATSTIPTPPTAPPTPATPILSNCQPDANTTDYSTAPSVFYLDAVNGLDTNTGSQANPWKTVARVFTYAAANPNITTTIFVKTGNYGVVSDGSLIRTQWLTFVADIGAKPLIERLSIVEPSANPPRSAYLRFVGFEIKPPNTLADRAAAEDLIKVDNISNVQIRNSKINAEKYSYNTPPGNSPRVYTGVNILSSQNVLLENNCITSVYLALQIQQSSSSSGIIVKRNYISPVMGSGIQYTAINNANKPLATTIIEDNHIFGRTATLYPTDPEAPTASFAHASAVAIKTSRVEVRNNIAHGMWSSSGIMLYFGNDPDYSDIKIEGNLVYDALVSQLFRLYNVGTNVLVRNNLFIGFYRSSAACSDGVSGFAPFRFEQVMGVEAADPFGDGSDPVNPGPPRNGSGMSVYNNIMIGASLLPATIVQEKNIYWSYGDIAQNWSASTPTGTNTVYVSAAMPCGTHPAIFETPNQFFIFGPDSHPFSGSPTYTFNHQKLINFKLHASSPAVNYGDVPNQLTRILGPLDSNGYFINPAAGTRDATRHSAGPFEP